MHEQRQEISLRPTGRMPRCPTCADRLIEVGTPICHPQTGNIIRLYRCDCGERVWNEQEQRSWF